MEWLYGLVIRGYGLLLQLAAFTGNTKARAWINGRKNWADNLKKSIPADSSWVWFHCASLGEFEQGRPLIERFRQEYPQYKILLTFFSPSGYEIRKNYTYADHVCYLPLDTAHNAGLFLDIVQPKKIFFIKYEFWFNLLSAAVQRNIPVYLVAAVFRQSHWFFKPSAQSFLSTLKKVTHFFVQDETSKNLLNAYDISNCTVTGDTRFDRVIQIAEESEDIKDISNWKKDQFLVVAGSTWLPDEELILDSFLRCQGKLKLVLVPHETNAVHITQLKKILERRGLGNDVLLYSERRTALDPEKQILIIDTIGLLSRVYRHGDLAYIGGGFGVGIHNSLEAAVYGIPLSWGPHYQKFREAIGLIEVGAAMSITTSDDLTARINSLQAHPAEKEQQGHQAKSFVYKHRGATQRILEQV